MIYADGQQRVLRVMSFNIWLSGKRVKNGLKKISDQIKAVDPDIVTIQELQTVEVGRNLTDLLGASKWQLIHHPNATYPDTAIITKHKFVSEPTGIQFQRNISDFLFKEDHFLNDSIVTYGLGASVELDDRRRINIFSLHLDWKSYGPYAANNKQVNSKKQIMIGERNKEGYGRAQNIEQLIASEAFKKYMGLSDEQLFIVAGDFNSPSHLDWIEEKKETHGGWTFEWPSTKLLTNEGFVDTYRHINPNVVKSPGETWSTVQKSVGPEWDWTIPEPQDRIDFIFYKPNSFSRPIRSETFAGQGQLSPIPDQWENEWPSDHYAVITDFAMDGGGK
uniref:Endonuclease/exonuclease/phosphatase domain-containing protein n=1 Tax=Globodera rostochiensis TaxID=31243 RepID=A0A914I5H6_GLORO